VDRPQRVRPGRHPDRGVRDDRGPDRLPAQPGAGAQLPALPGPARCAAVSGDPRARPDHLLAVRPPGRCRTRAGRNRRRHPPQPDR
jgi:hypothetical protein